MKLLSNWKSILKKAWSIRLLVIAGLLSGLEVILPYFADFMPGGVFSALSLAVISAAFVTRLLAQQGVSHEEAD